MIQEKEEKQTTNLELSEQEGYLNRRYIDMLPPDVIAEWWRGISNQGDLSLIKEYRSQKDEIVYELAPRIFFDKKKTYTRKQIFQLFSIISDLTPVEFVLSLGLSEDRIADLNPDLFEMDVFAIVPILLGEEVFVSALRTNDEGEFLRLVTEKFPFMNDSSLRFEGRFDKMEKHAAVGSLLANLEAGGHVYFDGKAMKISTNGMKSILHAMRSDYNIASYHSTNETSMQKTSYVRKAGDLSLLISYFSDFISEGRVYNAFIFVLLYFAKHTPAVTLLHLFLPSVDCKRIITTDNEFMNSQNKVDYVISLLGLRDQNSLEFRKFVGTMIKNSIVKDVF